MPTGASSWSTWLRALAACTVATCGHAADSLTLENASLSVGIDLRSGSIKSVARKVGASRQEIPLVAAQALRLRIPLKSWDGHCVGSDRGGRFGVKERARDSVTLTASRFASSEGNFPLSVEIHYRLEGDNLATRLRVMNRSRFAIDEITFPALGVAPAADGSETLSMTAGPQRLRETFSDNRIRTQHDPFERLDPEDMRGWIHDDPAFAIKAFQYPSGFLMHSAWMHYSAGSFGVGWESRDRSFQSQYAVIERKLLRDRLSAAANRRTYELSWKWQPQVAAGERWESPEIYLKFDAGDWHAVARQHREWLATWLARPVVAEKFKASLGWLSRGVSDFDQIPDIARQAVAVGAPYILLYGWYGSGMNGLSYDFFPQAILGGEASLRRNLRAARELGAYPLAWYNGTTTSEITREHREQAHDWVVMNRHGGWVVDGRWTLFDPDRPPTTDDNSILLNYDMATEAAAFNLDNVRRMILDYGFSGFEMDQGAKNYTSYSRRGTDLRPELRYAEGARRVYEGAQSIVKSADPNGIVLGEGYGDLINQYVDATWTFEGGFVSVPLHTYARYSLPWVTMPAGIYTPDPGYANQAFLMNAPLDIFLDVTPHPEFAEHLRNLHTLKQAVQAWLYDGDFSDLEGFTLRIGKASRVLAKSYVRRNQGTAIVVVNTGNQREVASLDVIGAEARSVTRYRLGAAAQGLPSGSPIAVDLAPYDINVIVLEQAAEP